MNHLFIIGWFFGQRTLARSEFFALFEAEQNC
jgi:hypothetical protein